MGTSLLIRVQVGDTETRYLFEERTVLVGRHPRGDLVFSTIRDPEVSARHAVIHADGTEVRIRDLCSTNGTYLNGIRLLRAAVLRPRDFVSLSKNGPRIRVSLVCTPDNPVIISHDNRTCPAE